MKITKITDEQKAQFQPWVDKWVAIGLSTEPADFDAATEAALKGYSFANLDRPKVVLRMASPYAATIGGALAVGLLSELRKTKPQVEQQVWQQVEQQVRQRVASGFFNYGIYSLWSSWAAYVSFFRDVMGWDDPILEKFTVDETLIKSCGWTWWHEDVLVISDRPEHIDRDDEGRLHSPIRKAIEYRDGWGFCAWHGVVIPSEWIERKESITPEIALTWQNIEQRRAACEIVGWAKILQKLNAKTIDADDDPEIGELLEVNLPDAGRNRFLRVKCGTGREFALAVPPDVNTALEASAWTYGLENDVKSYIPEVRT